MRFRIALGQPVKDTISGYKGVVVARADHISGCDTYGVQTKANKDGEYKNTWFDDNRLELIKGKKAVLALPEKKAKTGSTGTPKSTRQNPK